MADNPQLDPEDVAALKEMAQWWRNRGDGAMSRRRLLGLLGGAGLGAASVGGFMASEASAGTDSVGQIGTQSEPADAVLEDVMDSGGNNAMSFPGDGSVSVEKIGSRHLHAESYDGADADARLDAALSDASTGDVIYLERGGYTANRTISKDVEIRGGGGPLRPGSQVSADWTVNAAVSINQVTGGNQTLTYDGGFGQVNGGSWSQIQINADGVLVKGVWGVDVTFASGTSRGGADGLFGNSTVTDNGNNGIGDVF